VSGIIDDSSCEGESDTNSQTGGKAIVGDGEGTEGCGDNRTSPQYRDRLLMDLERARTIHHAEG